MKKKFVLTLALVLMVAAAVVAAPLEVSGEFKTGYKFTFANGTTIANADLDAKQSNLASIAFTGDFWKVTLSTQAPTFGGDGPNAATAAIYLDKALAAQGVDMGDLTVTLGLGDKGNLSAKDVYSDSNDAVNELAMLGVKNTADVTVGYGSLVSVYFGASIMDTVNKPMVISATTTPVEGIKAGFGYTNYAKIGDIKVAGSDVGDKISSKGGITGSVLVDVAKLADLDFGLTVSAIDVYYFEYDAITGVGDVATNKAINNLYAEVKASFGDVAAWAEYQNLDKTNNLIAKVSYAGIENVGLSAKLALSDLTGTIGTVVTLAGDYSMGGVKYAVSAAYDVKAESLAITPTVGIKF
ncbi:hypothetical protein SAMN06298221_103194 [Sphaerochaeta associata]|uniref:Uncharacterized protein n=1 Tax=Sphaerochaeta associata TaxID=1129264 RepID=A0ABY4DDB0_9SPIR|nr:hypothetical protein [Sphaerochaeta associata]UOM52233.1 hypothetical protein MUG09_05525 [Sphaerochaeta associata]SMP46068.1 hypothetical protein SAMN06298221_103194 [Sphaerochaeta associata]